jgi:hypothetical protein
LYGVIDILNVCFANPEANLRRKPFLRGRFNAIPSPFFIFITEASEAETINKTMNWKIDTRSMPAYLSVETTGEASPKSLAAMWDEILESNFWRPGLMVLMNIQKLKPIRNPDALTVAGIEYFAKKADRVGKTHISTITSHPEYFKYARQFQYGIRLHGCDVIIQLFGTETHAVEWLNYYCELPVTQSETVLARAN